jgi:hypothetical protein
MLPTFYSNNSKHMESDCCENNYDVSINAINNNNMFMNGDMINKFDTYLDTIDYNNSHGINSNNCSNHNSNSEIENIITVNDNKEYISQQEVSNDSSCYSSSSSSSSNISDDELDGSNISSSSSSTL